ncbi:hypothetical protein NDU88_006158 [Pleurodeles waltl]|uniref:Uncharacterized protein n=1 Tax=Pleurodeles waltl TaxID=8319 RepID=A0AAV7UNT9_PLEWA|nr:hypothetical protein NDU88_006158 [Pleurodeles waltl]
MFSVLAGTLGPCALCQPKPLRVTGIRSSCCRFGRHRFRGCVAVANAVPQCNSLGGGPCTLCRLEPLCPGVTPCEAPRCSYLRSDLHSQGRDVVNLQPLVCTVSSVAAVCLVLSAELQRFCYLWALTRDKEPGARWCRPVVRAERTVPALNKSGRGRVTYRGGS